MQSHNIKPSPNRLNCGPNITLTTDLIETLFDLFEVNEELQYIDRPHLFTADDWRHTIYDELVHIGTRDEVESGLQQLAQINFIDLELSSQNQGHYQVRLRSDIVWEVMTMLEKSGMLSAHQPFRRH